MRAPLIILFFLNFATSWGQDSIYPSIYKEGKKIADFVPAGWTVLDSAYGDLNNDNKNDLAVIFQGKDSIENIMEYEDGLEDSTASQPRILAIFFYNSSTQKYQLIEQNNSFILNHYAANMEDPYKSMEIDKRVLSLKFEIFDYTASLFMTTLTYKLRYQNIDFVLIGAENYTVDRGTSDYENSSFNFLSKKWSMTKGNVLKDGPAKVEWHTLDLKELKTLKTIGKPNTWEIIQGTFL